jgi:hypothetical protein
MKSTHKPASHETQSTPTTTPKTKLTLERHTVRLLVVKAGLRAGNQGRSISQTGP